MGSLKQAMLMALFTIILFCLIFSLEMNQC